MIICICRNISEKTIALHARQGQSFEDMQVDLGLSMQCGRCEDCARKIVDHCQRHVCVNVHGACGSRKTKEPLAPMAC